MPVYKAVIAYDGSAFSGFALQQDKPSVLGALKKAFLRVGINSEILGAGRTDKGVHSTGQVISFKSEYFAESAEFLRETLNSKLYPTIFIRSISVAPDGFHPRFCAKWRAYRYLLVQMRPLPFQAPYLSYEKIGDKRLFARALRLFEGTHNFEYFKKNGSLCRDYVRYIMKSRFYEYRDLGVVYIRGSGFLRSQVRLMVGSALAVSRGEISEKELQEQILCQAKHYSFPISPNGLYLCRVGY